MIINPEKHFIYKCSACECMMYDEFEIFEVRGNESLEIPCDCGKSAFTIGRKDRQYVVKFSCFVCREDHEFTLTFREFWGGTPSYFECPHEGVPIGCIGDGDAIEKWIGVYKKAADAYVREIMDSFGEFEGKEDVFEAMDIIDALEQNDKIQCSCGSHEFEEEMDPDEGIAICCRDCGSRKVFPIFTPEGMVELRGMEEITIESDSPKIYGKVVDLSELKRVAKKKNDEGKK